MIRLRGKPAGSGSALGTALLMRGPRARPTMPASVAAEGEQIPRDGCIEPLEVVLVAPDLDVALAARPSWARVVGAVLEQPVESAPFPAVAGVENALRAVPEESLVLVDADRGMVVVDPDATTLAAYQAEKERIAPRRRFFVERAHEVARTVDGRELRVLVSADTIGQAVEAALAGADGIYAPTISAGESEPEEVEALSALARTGKPVIISGDLALIAANALLRAASAGDLGVALPLSAGPEQFAMFVDYLAEASLALEDEPIGPVRMAAVCSTGDPLPEDLGAFPISRLIVEAVSGPSDSLAWLGDAVERASGVLIPVFVRVPEWQEWLTPLLGLGAAGIILSADEVQPTKDAIRELAASDARRMTAARAGGGTEGD